MILKGRKYRILTLSILFLLLSILNPIKGQGKEVTEAEKLFKQIEEGFASGSVDKFSSYFTTKIVISLSNEMPKYYSSNQAYYLVKNFLSIHTPTGFKFEFQSAASSNPFASGELKFIKSGLRGKYKVLVTLQNDKKQWKISQITIN